MVVHRPYVVSVRWLVDCLKQSRTVKEDEYICSAATDANRTSSNRYVLFTTHLVSYKKSTAAVNAAVLSTENTKVAVNQC